MITKNEISSLNLSPTKKDFVQIWNELIEVASKITERWDPTSTNESDPGIVLLKVLAGIADKLNYNIDKNILEAFMPTAAQMESMRKLCELVGYDIKYYQSAETKVRINYTGNTTDTEDNEEKLPVSGLALPKFTTITNADKDITFVTTNVVPVLFTNAAPWVEVSCIEGQISQCESMNENNLITLSQLDDNNRYYLPEIQIAENGIFVYNAVTSTRNDIPVISDGTAWTRVSNLNTQPSESRVFKFGFDSFEGRPYLAFPDDVGSLIGDGLFIYFVRTSGLSGNISPRTLEALEIPTDADWENYSAEQFEVVNVDATTNGANIESISSAYNNFKKTVGTFDTLVTCRDYMNKIYSLMENNLPYVSNILVTDIRNDINNAITLCSCNESGILYKETPLTKTTHVASSIHVEDPDKDNIYKLIVTKQPDYTIEEPLIDHFDLLLYPFKTFTQVSSGATDLVEPYNKSFTYTEQRVVNGEFEAALADIKTCAHKFVPPDYGDIVAINNYLRLNAFIATSTKVSEIEAKSILQNVKVALVNEFNLRNLDFGEEIPFDSILSVIENADSRIKVVSLQEPVLLTTYSVKEYESGDATSKEYGIVTTADDKNNKVDGVWYDSTHKTAKGETAKDLYNKLVLRNILAGRASLFNYDETFVSNNAEKPYTITELRTDIAVVEDKEPGEYVLDSKGPNGGILTLLVTENKDKEVYETYEPFDNNIIDNITRVEATCEITGVEDLNDSVGTKFNNITLDKNEVIKFRAPNLITTKTFPAYVYYHFERSKRASTADGGTNDEGSCATAISLTSFINSVNGGVRDFFTGLWTKVAADTENESNLLSFTWKKPTGNEIDQSNLLPGILNSAIAIYTEGSYVKVEEGTADSIKYDDTYYIYNDNITTIFTDRAGIDTYINITKKTDKTEVVFKYYPLADGTIETWSSYIKDYYKTKIGKDLPNSTATLWRLSSASSFPKGRLVTESGRKLSAQNGEYLKDNAVGDVTYICTDLGKDPVFYSVTKDSDVELRSGDKLYIHYTPSSTNEDGETVNAEPVSIVYSGDDKEPVILKPSFELIPSEDVNKQGTSWKKTGVDFGVHGTKNLLSLGANEQIELRSISKVVLDTPARFYKNFDNDKLEEGALNGYSYELKDGEYIFYTNQNTQEAAYYGSGSVITLDKNAFIPKANVKMEVSEILKQGLHTVPWSDYVLLSPTTKVTITEYQYITLTEGDTLNTLTLASGNTINADWTKCSGAAPITYTVSGEENSTPINKIDLKDQEPAAEKGSRIGWEVCSLLELSTSPDYSQTLMTAIPDEVQGTPTESAKSTKSNKIKVYSNKYVDGIEIAPKETTIFTADGATKKMPEPISIKLNTVAQVASGSFKKPTRSAEDDTDDFNIQMKIFKEDHPKVLTLSTLDDTITPISSKASTPVDTYTGGINNYWTKVDISNSLTINSVPKALKLNFMIPDPDMFGIFSIYLEVPEDRLDPNSKQGIPKADECRVFIDIPKEFGSYKDVIQIFNYNGGNEPYWWSEGVVQDNPNRLYLRVGLNCIKVLKSCSLLIKAQAKAAGNILYDNMRLVKGVATHGINLKLLDFQDTSETQTQDEKGLANAVLSSISALDKNNEFYYNVPVENSLAMEFDNNINSFSNPYTLYDINNVNNSFVVSKLDVKYLDTGLKIAKSSRY